MTIQLTTEYGKLASLGIEATRLSQYQVVLLPENIFRFEKQRELYDAGEARHFAKLLQLSQVRCATIFDFGIDVGLLERRSHDRRLGVVWIRDVVILPSVIGVLSSLVVGELQKPSERRIEPKVHVELYIERGPNVTKLSYSGDGPTLVEMLRAIDPKKSD